MNRRIVDVEKVEGGQKVTQDMKVERILVEGIDNKRGRGDGKKTIEKKNTNFILKMS